MKIDTLVKVTLVLIALFLGIIALRPFFEVGKASANPGGKFDYVHFFVGSTHSNGQLVVDLRNGNLWEFPEDLNKDPIYHGRFRLEALDKPVKK